MMTTMNLSGDILGYNDQALQELAWAIEASLGEFSLTFAHCNYTRLRQQLIDRLQNLCPVELRTIVLKSDTTTLYTAIQESLLQHEKPDALMVLGLEFVADLPQVLSSANKVREEFRKNFCFPIVIWASDTVLEQLIQWAPDFKSWATTTEFVAATDALLQGMQEGTDELFARLLTPRHSQSFPKEPPAHTNVYRWEAHIALQDLDRRGEVLEPALSASMDFVLGREADAEAKREFEAAQNLSANRYMEAARQYYQQSLEYWQQVNHLERQGVLLHHLGQNYCRQAEYYESRQRIRDTSDPQKLDFCWGRAKYYLHQSLLAFSQAHRTDLVAEFISELGKVLEHRKHWEILQKLAEKSLVLHQTDRNFCKLAQDYGFLANVALKQSRWQDAYDNAQQMLDVIRMKVANRPRLYQTGLFYLAQAQHQLGQTAKAIATLEEAWKISERSQKIGVANPQLDLQVLELLHTLYLEQQRYLEAFQVKHAQYSVEQQYGLRAFIGPGRLKSQRQVYFTTSETEQPATIAQEILVSGRQKHVQELVNRLKEYRFKLTVLYGPSGVGKSSVIEAGLIPALKQETVRGLVFLPILQRNYTHWVEELGTRLAEALKETDTPCSPDLDSIPVLLEQLKRNEQHHLLTVLIFDQFEEFFFTCRDPSEHKQFAEFLCQCLNLSEVKVIVSLREDYLHRLLRYSHDVQHGDISNGLLSNILHQDNLCYIGNLTPEDTQSLIQALSERSQACEPDLIEALVNDLATNSGEVRPIELQIVGFQLEEERITTLTQYLENGKQEMVQRYLDAVVADCGAENHRVAELVLYLLTDENNTRPIKTQAQLETDLQAIAQELLEEAAKLNLVLQIFVEAGIVLLMRESPADRYQLVHDYLVTIIRHQQETRLPQLKLELEKEKDQRQQAEAERDRALQNLHEQNDELRDLNKTLAKQKVGLEKTRQNLIAAAAGLIVLTGVLGAFALQIRKGEVAITASHSESLLTSNQELDALETSLQALESHKRLAWAAPLLGGAHRGKNSSLEDIRNNIKQVLQEAVHTVQEDHRLKAHRGAVRSLSFSPDGQTIATASEDNTLQLWDLENPQMPTSRRDHQGAIYAVSFSPDGQMLATASGDHTVKLWWRKCDWQCPYTLEAHQAAVYSVSFSSDGQMLATASADHTVKLWQKNGQFIRTLEAHQAPIRAAIFHPSGETIVTASEDQTVKLWSLDGELLQTLSGHLGSVYGLSYSPDGQFLATASADHTVRLWRQDGQFLHTLSGHQAPVRSVSFSPDGQTIATAGEDNTVKLWGLDGQYLQTLTGHEEPIYQVSYAPNGMLATASADTTVKLWQLNPQLREHARRITAIAFSPVEPHIITAAEDHTVKLWHQKGQYLRSLGEHQTPIRLIRFSPDGQTIATTAEEPTVELWSPNGEQLRLLTGHLGRISNISFSTDGRFIATASADGTVKLWDQQGTELKTLTFDQAVLDVAFSSEGQTITVLSQDYTIHRWSGEDWTAQTMTASKVHDLSDRDIDFAEISPDGQILAIANQLDHTVTLWDIETQVKLASLIHAKPLKDLNFSPDGQWVATASKDKTVRLWNLQGAEQAKFTWHHQQFVENVSFSPDSASIALGGTSGRIVLWDWQQDIHELEQLGLERVERYRQRERLLERERLPKVVHLPLYR
ncbi:WD40 domain-containing protein [Egbenema bharatensis]|uniref:WD40 domain-containing protein n=1 Tax=Egbenema bharatensis TaxID=3463334 RepID=UPI003A87FFAC